MPIDQLDDKVVLKHPKGPTVELLYYGGTVVSWKTNGIERLFVSNKASIDGSRPVRGGIPVVFPCFGAPTHPDHTKLPQHGFARSEKWSFDSVVMDNAAGVSVRLTLGQTDRIQSKYGRDFELAYVVTLAEYQLSTDLHVHNPAGGSQDLEFQALFHTYFRVPASFVKITPLYNLGYYDKTQQNDKEKAVRRVEMREEVRIDTFTDYVYEKAPGNYKVTWADGEIKIKTKNLNDVVIWNPQEQGKKLADMEDGGWENFVCVEPGVVCGFVKIRPGESWIGQQALTIV